MMKYPIAISLALTLSACSATLPTTEFASENGISLRYSAYDEVLTLTAEAREMAIQHCARFGKFANYRGGNAVSVLSAEEVHNFVCENTKTDDSAIIAAQSTRPSSIFIATY